jgi:hypothetical protein
MRDGPCGKAAYFTDNVKHAYDKSANKKFMIYAEYICNYDNKKPFSIDII